MGWRPLQTDPPRNPFVETPLRFSLWRRQQCRERTTLTDAGTARRNAEQVVAVATMNWRMTPRRKVPTVVAAGGGRRAARPQKRRKEPIE